MPSYYFDSIDSENKILEEETIVYFVKDNESGKYGIRAISSGLNRLVKDPTTGSKEYRRFDTSRLLANSSNSILFPNDSLTDAFFSAEEIQTHLSIDPNKLEKMQFDANGEIALALVVNALEEMQFDAERLPAQAAELESLNSPEFFSDLTLLRSLQEYERSFSRFDLGPEARRSTIILNRHSIFNQNPPFEIHYTTSDFDIYYPGR